jgi:hypothetical protein
MLLNMVTILSLSLCRGYWTRLLAMPPISGSVSKQRLTSLFSSAYSSRLYAAEVSVDLFQRELLEYTQSLAPLCLSTRWFGLESRDSISSASIGAQGTRGPRMVQDSLPWAIREVVQGRQTAHRRRPRRMSLVIQVHRSVGISVGG